MDHQSSKEGLASKALGVVGWIVGAAVGSYSGINLLIALFASFGIWVAGSRLLKDEKKLILPVLSINGGHFLWLGAGLILLGPSALETVGGDLLLYAVGLSWLFMKPSTGPLYLLGIVQALSLGVNGYAFAGADVGSAAHKALVVHLIWRSMSLFVVVKLLIAIRKRQKQTEVPIAP